MHYLSVSLPFLAFALLFGVIHRRNRGRDWRHSFLIAATSLVSLTVLATELLSLGHGLTFAGIVGYWLLIVTLSGVMWIRGARIRDPASLRPQAHFSLDVVLLLAALAAFVLTIGVIGIIAPPNTGDTFEYHMPKVMQWIQNRSVAFFPTAVPRQNHLAPGAEYGILHLSLLTGSDRFANSIEWFSLIGSLVAVSLIAQQFGASLRGQMLAAVFTATLPMGIMQASSTQTDFVAAFWIVCFLALAMQSIRSERCQITAAFIAGLALGLAIFSKATSYLFAGPFALVFVGLLFRRHRIRAFAPALVFGGAFLALNLTHYVRNASVYGHPLGPGEEPAPNTRYAMESHSPAALVSSLAKNIGSHIQTPWSGFNARAQQLYLGLHRRLSLDLNDPRTSWGAGNLHRFNIRGITYHDEVDGNPVHLVIIIGTLVAVLLIPAIRRDRGVLGFSAIAVLSALLFVGYLKWHPWMSRLHLPWFVLMAPFVGVVIGRFASGKSASIAGATLLLLGVPWLLYCQERPLVGKETVFNTPRDQQYFMVSRLRRLEAPFRAGQAFLQAHRASRIGIIESNSSIEYWWWAIAARDNPAMQFQHVNVSDPSGQLSAQPPFERFSPEALLVLDQRPLPDSISVGSAIFTKHWEQARAAIYLPKT